MIIGIAVIYDQRRIWTIDVQVQFFYLFFMFRGWYAWNIFKTLKGQIHDGEVCQHIWFTYVRIDNG